MLTDPVIVIPGITATYLEDRYNLPHETIWAVITKDYERAALHPDDLRYEAREPALVRSGQLYEIAYEELIEELRYNLSERETLPVPVYPYGYDWRHPLERIATDLEPFIEEVITRTALLRHYDKDGYGDRRKVNLVGHSMGGLVIQMYLARKKAESRVNRVVSLATPFRGSFESIPKLTTGTANLGSDPQKSRERDAARMTPALYYLLPDLVDDIEVADGLTRDLFAPEAWQPSILQTIEQYVRDHGLKSGGRKEQARDIFTALLDAARKGRLETLAKVRLEDAGLTGDDWLCVAGADAETRVRLSIVKRGRAPEFEFRSIHLQNRWESDIVEERWQTGDGTVPLRGAVPQFLPPEKVVCVRPGDFGYWEIGDKAALQLGGFHGILPNMNMVHRLIVRFLKDLKDTHGNTWGAPLPGVAKDAWSPPLNGGLRHRA